MTHDGPGLRKTGPATSRVHHTTTQEGTTVTQPEPEPEPETEEQRTDRLETERDHAAGDHEHCGVDCEATYPSDQLRNFILAKGYPGTGGALGELLRRVAIRTAAGQDQPTALSWAEGVASHGTGPTATIDIDVTIPGHDEPVPMELPLTEARLLHRMVGDLITEHAPAGQDQPHDRRADAERPLSPDYEHPACGFHWHGRDGMDIPIRDGQPVCPRCELDRLRAELAQARSAALLEVIAALDEAAGRFFAEWPDEPKNSPWACGWKDATSGVRRMAAEAQQDTQPEEQPPVHLRAGANAEGCPACTNPPYPFICPRPTTEEPTS